MAEFASEGARLRYEVFGEGLKPVVLLNGIAMSISHWKPVVDALAEREGGCRILCHDFRGQTLSDKPPGPYSFALHARDLAALMQSGDLGAEGFGPAHIVGTSYGAEVAIAFAAANPELCLSLTLIDGVSELDPLLEAAAESWLAAAKTDPVVFYRTLIPWNYSPAYIAANKEALRSREEAIAKLPRPWFEGFARLCEAFLRINLTPSLGDISCPTRIIVGELDILKGLRFATILQKGIAGSELRIIPGAGHAVAVEMPAKIAEEIWEFIRFG
jgi:3-oxoadipate enol-lactonase